MRTVTKEEIQQSVDFVHGSSESETRKLVHRSQKEQPFIQVYVAAICQRIECENENDADAFVNLATIICHAMRRAAGSPLVKVKRRELENQEELIMQVYDYAEGKPEAEWPSLVQSWTDGYNQRPLLQFVLDTLMTPKNPYAVTEDGSGMIFTHLKVLIDCLDNAKSKRGL